MPYTTPITSTAGTTLTATWMNTYVRDNTAVAQVCTSSTRPTGNALYQGVRIYETDTKRILWYDGSTWQRVSQVASGGRTSFAAARSSTSLAVATVTDLAWSSTSVDSDVFMSSLGKTVTIPTGLGGIYAITIAATLQTGIAYTRVFADVTLTGSAAGTLRAAAGTESFIGASWTLPLAAGDTLATTIFQNNGSTTSRTYTASLWINRLSI